MSKFKKMLSWVLVVALTAGISIAGTMAYLTSEDSDVNVMTLGNVKIKQLEYERIVDESSETGWKAADIEYAATFGNDTYYPDALQEFSQAKPLYPAVYQEGNHNWDDRNGSQASSGAGSHQQSWLEIGAPGSNQLFDNSVKNVVDKFVFVENTGKSDAYVRTVFAFEAGSMTADDMNDKLLHTNTNAGAWTWVGGTNIFSDDMTVTIGGVKYYLAVATYTRNNGVVTPGEITRPSLLQVFLDPTATNELCASFGETYEILAVSQAVQAAGFADGTTALNAAFGEITTTNHPWMNPVSSAEELEKVIADGETAIILDADIELNAVLEVNGELTILGNGNAITAPEEGTRVVNAQDNTEDVVITLCGVTLDGSDKERGVSFYNNTGALEVNIVDCEINANYYGVNVAGGNTAAVLNIKDSTLTGYCAFQTWSANTVATFDNCVLEGVNSWFNNAQYPTANDFATVLINEGANNTVLTFNNCTIVATEADGEWAATEYHLVDDSTGSTVVWNNCTFVVNEEVVSGAVVEEQ